MANEESFKIVSFITPGAGGSCVRAWLTFSKTSSLLCRMVQTSFDDVSIAYCAYYENSLYCSFPLPLLIFIYFMMGLLIWQEVSIQSLILRWPVKPMDLLFVFRIGLQEYIKNTVLLFKTNYTIGKLQEGEECTKLLWRESFTWKNRYEKLICSDRIQEIDIKRYINT